MAKPKRANTKKILEDLTNDLAEVFASIGEMKQAAGEIHNAMHKVADREKNLITCCALVVKCVTALMEGMGEQAKNLDNVHGALVEFEKGAAMLHEKVQTLSAPPKRAKKRAKGPTK